MLYRRFDANAVLLLGPGADLRPLREARTVVRATGQTGLGLQILRGL